MSERVNIRVFSAIVFIFAVLFFSFTDTPVVRRASMQAKANVPQTQMLPDLGIGASLNGARPFPANNAWNIDISRYPVHPNSVNLIASIGTATGLHPDFGTFWNNEPIG